MERKPGRKPRGGWTLARPPRRPAPGAPAPCAGLTSGKQTGKYNAQTPRRIDNPHRRCTEFHLAPLNRKAFGPGEPRSGVDLFGRLSSLWVTRADAVSGCLRSAATRLRPTADSQRHLHSLAAAKTREITSL